MAPIISLMLIIVGVIIIIGIIRVILRPRGSISETLMDILLVDVLSDILEAIFENIDFD